MERIPEPELMEDGEQARQYAAADFSAGDAAVVERIMALAGGAGPGALVLDLGCGPGNISFRLAERCPASRVIGLDGSAAMLAIAHQRRQAEPQRWRQLEFRCLKLPLSQAAALALCGQARSVAAAAGAAERLGESAAACSPPPAGATALVSNSLLHHLHDPAVLWHSLRQLAAPGALVYIRDLRRPETPAAVEALVDRHAAGAAEILRRDYRASLHAAFTTGEVGQQLQQAGLKPWLQVAPLDDRYLEVWGVLS